MEIAARIARFNVGRDRELLAVKYKKMRKSPFSFFRGSAHLFWEDLAAGKIRLPDSPAVWACGDLHLENFGAFLGDDGVACFDLNDFDEGALAPATWEVARFVTGVYVAGASLELKPAKATALAERFLDGYQAALRPGKPGRVERANATGIVRKLLHRVGRRKRALLVESRTTRKKGKTQLRVDGRHTVAVDDRERSVVTRWLTSFAASQADPGFFDVLDVARRIAGLGSLGLERYAVLVRGDGDDANAIIDAKQAPRSSLAQFTKQRQPRWSSEPDRIVAIQRRMQSVAPALLAAVKIGGGGYVLRELQPSKDRLSLKEARADPHLLGPTIETMGKLTAWAQLRSSGRQGSARMDDLIAFAATSRWRRRLVDYCRAYRLTVERDYDEFCSTARISNSDRQPGRD